jgi:hypothetical protein
MAIQLTEEHQRIINSKSGIPTQSVKLFDTTAAHNSKGFQVTYYDIRSVPNQEIPPTKGEDPIYIFGQDHTEVWGVPIRTHYANQLRFDYANGFPEGINEGVFTVEDDIGRPVWGAIFDGYLIVDEDVLLTKSSGNIFFKVFCSVVCRLFVNGEIVTEGVFPEGRLTGITAVQAGQAVHVRLVMATLCSLEPTGTAVDVANEDVYVALEWRRTSPVPTGTDARNRLADAGNFVPGATVDNVVGSAVGDFIDPDTGLVTNDDPTVWINSPIQTTLGAWFTDEEFILTFAETGEEDGSFDLFINDELNKSVQAGTIDVIDFGEDRLVTLKWGEIKGNSVSILRSPNFLQPLVDVNGLPHIQDVTIQRDQNQAATLTFTVPLTKARFDKNRIDPDNCYSFDPETGSMGVLRNNRLVFVEQGYSGNLETQFKGFISEIQIQDTADTKTLTVMCIDYSKRLIEQIARS